MPLDARRLFRRNRATPCRAPIMTNYVNRNDSSPCLAATTLAPAPVRVAYLVVDPVTISSPHRIPGCVEQFGHVGPRSPDSACVRIVGDRRSSPSAIRHSAAPPYGWESVGSIVGLLRGAAGKYRCSVLYPGGKVEVYWSLTDDSGGSLP
jgi:hypothetical protein